MTFNRPQGDPSGVDIGVRIITDEQQLRRSDAAVKTFKRDIDQLERGFNETARAAATMQKQQTSLAKQTREAAGLTRRWEQELDKVRRQRALVAIERDFVKAVKSGKDLEAQIGQIEARLKAVGATEGEVSGLLSRVAGRGTGAQALQALGREARLSIPAFPIPGTGLSTEAGFRVVEIIGRLGVGLKELAVVGPLGVGAVVGLGLAIQNFANTVEPIANLLTGLVQGRAELAALLETGTPEEIVAEARRRNRDLAAQKARREQLAADLDQLTAELERQQPDIGDIARAALSAPSPDIGFIVDEIIAPLLADKVGPLADLRAEFADLGNEITENENALIALNKVLEEQQRLAEANQFARSRLQAELSLVGQSAEAIQGRIDQLNAEQEAIAAFIDANELSEEVLAELTDKQQSIAIQLLAAFNALPGAQEIAAAEEALREQEEARQTLLTLSQRAIQIQEQGEARRARIVEQGNDQIENAEKRLTDARTKLIDFNTEVIDKRNDINAKFMAEDIERVEEFREQEARIQRDADKERLRALDDHRDDLVDAEIENNVARFLQVQRDFKKQRRRETQDRRTAADDRLDDLEAERDKAREVRDEKLAALDEEAAKKRADLQAEIAERETALEEVKQQIAERLQAEKTAQDEALRNLVQGLDTSTARMISTIDQGFAVLEASGIETFDGIIASLQRKANLLASRDAFNTTRPLFDRNIRPLSVRGRSGPLEFQHGGIAPANELIRLNENGVESGLNARGQLAVFSSPTRVFTAADTTRLLKGAGQRVINFNHYGDIRTDDRMTREEFRTEMTHILTEVSEGVAGARYGRLPA